MNPRATCVAQAAAVTGRVRNDSAGVTAEFNRNMLSVINTSLDADLDPELFEHVAFYDEENAWIEMRLRARRPQRVRIPSAGLELRLEHAERLRLLARGGDRRRQREHGKR